jgi:hypothetical protein
VQHEIEKKKSMSTRSFLMEKSKCADWGKESNNGAVNA